MPNMAVRIDPIKLICSLHVTQLDEKLDLEKMVVDGCGCENMCQKILVKWRMDVKRMMMKECGCNSNPSFPTLSSLIFKILVCGAQICDLLLHPFSLVPWEQSTWGGGCLRWVFFNPFNPYQRWLGPSMVSYGLRVPLPSHKETRGEA